MKDLLVDNIYKSFTWDDLRRAEALDGYRQNLNNVQFDKAEEPVKPVEIADPHIAKRRKTVEKLSNEKVTIEAIAIQVNAKRSTVIRDRDVLGITRKRTKKYHDT